MGSWADAGVSRRRTRTPRGTVGRMATFTMSNRLCLALATWRVPAFGMSNFLFLFLGFNGTFFLFCVCVFGVFTLH